MQAIDNLKAAVRVTGTVTSFHAGKGYGFVAHNGGDELFVDLKANQDDGACILAIGDRVRYVIMEGSDGPFVTSARAY